MSNTSTNNKPTTTTVIASVASAAADVTAAADATAVAPVAAPAAVAAAAPAAATANVSYQPTLSAPLSSKDADALAAVIFEEGQEQRDGASAAACSDAAESSDVTAEGVSAPAAAAAADSAVAVVASQEAPSAASSAPDAPASGARVSAPQHCTYADCLMGRASVPVGGPGKGVFQLLMVGGMVTFMATINGVMHSGLGFFAHAHWMYPLVFCIAFLVRLYIGDKAVGYLAPRLVMPHFQGLARSIAMTVLNVLVMGLIMGAAVNMLLSGPAGFLSAYLSSLPVTLTVAALVNFFIVGPAVKMLYNNVVEPTYGLRIFNFAHRYGMSWAVIFGN